MCTVRAFQQANSQQACGCTPKTIRLGPYKPKCIAYNQSFSLSPQVSTSFRRNSQVLCEPRQYFPSSEKAQIEEPRICVSNRKTERKKEERKKERKKLKKQTSQANQTNRTERNQTEPNQHTDKKDRKPDKQTERRMDGRVRGPQKHTHAHKHKSMM